MPNIKTVKPGGGGDYSSLALWEDFADGEATADQWAECYTGNLGTVLFSGWTATPTATLYPKIYAASGEQHDGVDPTSGAHISTAATVNCIDSALAANFLKIEGIAISHTGAATRGIYMEAFVGSQLQGVEIRNCLFNDGDAVGSRSIHLFHNTVVTSHPLIIENNICVSSLVCLEVWSNNTATLNTIVRNNSFESRNGSVAPVLFKARAVSSKVSVHNVTSDNNISMGVGTNFQAGVGGSGGTETINVTQENCLSEDATADDWGGSGNLINQTRTDIWTDPDNNDFSLKDGSNAIDAGKTIVAITTDILGVTRPQGTLYDIGALEMVTSSVVASAITTGDVTTEIINANTQRQGRVTANSGSPLNFQYYRGDSDIFNGQVVADRNDTRLQHGKRLG